MSAATEFIMIHRASPSVHRCPAAQAAGRLEASVVHDPADELANSLTHGLGLVLSVAGLYGLIRATAGGDSIWRPIGCDIFGLSLVAVYATSTLYHSWPQNAVKRVLLLCDHIAIYLLIAGTYTPVALIALRGSTGWALLAVAWGTALVGSLGKVARFGQLHGDSPWPYVALGWMGLAVLGGLRATLPAVGILWLVAGGFFYMAGLAFFLRRDRRFHHAIWHLFVLAGSICHYRAMIDHVVCLTT
jgi:hemolysin III